jgi:hypothetical protein
MGHGEGLGHGLADRWEGLEAQLLGYPACVSFSGRSFSGFRRGQRRSVCAAPDTPRAPEGAGRGFECNRDFATGVFSGLQLQHYAVVAKMATGSIRDGFSLAVQPLPCGAAQQKHMQARFFPPTRFSRPKGPLSSICGYSGVLKNHLPFGYHRSDSHYRSS